MQINNIELIKQILNFEKEGDFYMLYIFKRKKDQEDKDNHQSVRTIKTYCVESIEDLEKKYDEIKQLSEIFKARVYIHIQKQNHNDVGLDMMLELAKRLKNGVSNQAHLFETVVGQLKTYEKFWIVDVDTKDKKELEVIKDIIVCCRPIGYKLKAIIPTNNGYHLITEKFDVMDFKKYFPKIDIQKKNPTLLYYPNSL